MTTTLLLYFSAKCALMNMRICVKAVSNESGVCAVEDSSQANGLVSIIRTSKLESSNQIVLYVSIGFLDNILA